MRGKLRDKRPDTKRESFKRELMERRRTNKRENRTMSMVWLNKLMDQEDELLEHTEEVVLEKTH